MALALCATLPMLAQTSISKAVGFDVGSNGSFGALNVTADTTLPLPTDGIIQATSVHVASGATLRFNANPNNTPVYLLATGEITIDGTINISGESGTTTRGGHGGPGGFDGGEPGSVGVEPGSGKGPGGGRWMGGRGSAAAHQGGPDPNIASSGDGRPYGNALQRPPVGGSGGSGHPDFGAGGAGGGGGGGGAIMVASNVRVVVGAQGAILARGADAFYVGQFTAGSGGSIVVVAPLVEGSGTLSVSGGVGYLGPNPRGPAGSGWIRIDALDRTKLNFKTEGTGPSIGSLMMVFPNPRPRLDIVEAGGQMIALNSGPVTIVRPTGTDPNIAVKIQARDFKGKVPVQLYATPDSGERAVYSAQIDNTTSNPAEATISLSLPTNVRVTLHAFAGKDLPTTP